MTIDSQAAAAEGPAPDLVSRHLRRNFLVLASDNGLFSLGITFASAATILPAFAEHLGASNLVIGAIPSISILGHALPPLFTAHHAEGLPRKLPFILFWTIFERLPMLIAAALVYFLAVSHPDLVLAGVLVMMGIIAILGGALAPAWTDLIGKVIPTTYRGRLFAYGNTMASGLGLGGAVLSGYYLRTFAFPVDYSLCFATGFLCLVLSYVCLASTIEPAVPSRKPPEGLGSYFRRLPEVLAGDRHFTWFLVSRAIWVFGSMANGFYTVFALRNLGAPEWQVATFTFVLLAAQTAAGIAFGYLADLVGHKPVLVIGLVAMVFGNLVALVAGSVEVIYLAFVGMAIGMAAVAVSALALAMEFAPPGERPTYIGLSNTLISPLMIVSPLIGGALADQAGYRAVFAVAGLFSAAGAWVLWARVRDPRRTVSAG